MSRLIWSPPMVDRALSVTHCSRSSKLRRSCSSVNPRANKRSTASPGKSALDPRGEARSVSAAWLSKLASRRSVAAGCGVPWGQRCSRVNSPLRFQRRGQAAVQVVFAMIQKAARRQPFVAQPEQRVQHRSKTNQKSVFIAASKASGATAMARAIKHESSFV